MASIKKQADTKTKGKATEEGSAKPVLKNDSKEVVMKTTAKVSESSKDKTENVIMPNIKKEKPAVKTTEKVAEKKPVDKVVNVEDNKPVDKVAKTETKKPVDKVTKTETKKPVDKVTKIEEKKPHNSKNETKVLDKVNPEIKVEDISTAKITPEKAVPKTTKKEDKPKLADSKKKSFEPVANKVSEVIKIKDTVIESKPVENVVKEEIISKPVVITDAKPANLKEDGTMKSYIPDNVRYSDVDLEEFHTKIVDMRREALEELGMLKDRLEDLTNYDFAEESMIYSMHMAEQGSEAMEKEKTYAQIQRINEYLKKLDEALQRIHNKTYGICRVCGCLIAKERLLAVPITTLSASYKIHKKCPENGLDVIEPVKA